MSTSKKAQPDRPLSTNFTTKTLALSVAAKRRQNRYAFIKGIFTMKEKTIFKRPAGAFVALAIAITGGAGVYAATNWFDGSIKVKADSSIMSVDVSGCPVDVQLGGIEPTADRSNLQFKILGSPHISEQDLEQRLLADCEWTTAYKLHNQRFGSMLASTAVVKAINTSEKTVTLDVQWGGQNITKVMPFSERIQVFDKNRPASINELKAGDFVVASHTANLPLIENQNPYDFPTVLEGLFKTQYDLRSVTTEAKKKPLYGPETNIMPLDQYNALHR